MDTAQVCDRRRGQETCPFHKGHRISTLCKTCGILVCLKCMTSSEHGGHYFKEITSCLREPTDNLARHIKEIEKRLLKAVDKELSEMQNQRAQSVEKHTNGTEKINEQRKQAHLQIDTNADSMVVQWDEHSQQVLGVLDKHILGLESLRSQLHEERKECAEILQKGSNILKFDAGLEIPNKTKMQRISKPPTISELEYKKCDQNFDVLVLKAMGTLKKVNSKPDVAEESDNSQASSREIVKHHQYEFIKSISNTNNDSPNFAAINPIGKNTAWAREVTYDEKTKNYSTKMLYIIDSGRDVVQQIKLDTNIFWLQTHPITKQLFLISDDKDKVRSIDTATGKTTKVVKSAIEIHRMKVTHDNHVIVGSRHAMEAIYKYKLTGELMKKSTERYKVNDIDYRPQTNRVAVSRSEEGLTLLNYDLTVIKTFNRTNMYCRSAIFNSHGNLIVADSSNKEIIVLDGENLSYIQKLEIDSISSLLKLKLYDNVLKVECSEPKTILCVQIS